MATYGCNNRTATANIVIGFGADTKNTFTFFSDITNIARYGSGCATFVFTNPADYDITIYGLLQSNVDIDVMFVMCDYIIIK